MGYRRQLNDALTEAAEALRAVSEATCERRMGDGDRHTCDDAEDERRRLRHCLRELRELGDSLREAVKALCGAAKEECEEPCCDEDAPCEPTVAPLPPYPPYPPFAPYPPYPPYPPIVVIGGGGGCGCHCQGAAAASPANTSMPSGAPTAAPASGAAVGSPPATSAAGAAPFVSPSLAATAGGFPDPAGITDVESLLDTAESAAALVRRAIPTQATAAGD